jgi:5'-deoxynucleotidase YfbR-like HD superfamily hydrolase
METYRPSTESRERIKQDIDFIRAFLQQMDQIRALRWANENDPKFLTPEETKKMQETVGEHTGQMNALAAAFYLKAEAENDESINSLDGKIISIKIAGHDLEENIAGDARTKDAAYFRLENKARVRINEATEPLNFGNRFTELQNEYQNKLTKEDRFIKAIDELQAWFFIVYTRKFDYINRDFSKPEEIKGYLYSEEFPTIRRIMNIMVRIMRNPKSITSEIPTLELIKEQYAPS